MPFTDLNMQWQPAITTDALPPWLRELMLDQCSLTQKLKQLHNEEFFVRLISQQWQELAEAERVFLSCNDRHANIREVLLFGSGQPVVFARCALPESSLVGDNVDLLSLGERPLGEYIFKQPGLRRHPMEYTRFPAEWFNRYLDINAVNETLWARRSLFYLREKPISVCEVFLPGVIPGVNSAQKA